MSDNNLIHMPKSSTQFAKFGTIMMGAGAVGGAIYGFKHPSEKVCTKILNSGLSIVDTLQGYKDSFDMSAAAKAVSEQKLTLNDYTKTEKIVNAISEALEHEKNIKEIADTPFNQRKTSLSEAVKIANKSRANFRKTILSNFNTDLKNKLIEFKIYDNEKFLQVMQNAGKKGLSAIKELSKSALKGAAKGVFVGALITGAFYAAAKSISSKGTNKLSEQNS